MTSGRWVDAEDNVTFVSWSALASRMTEKKYELLRRLHRQPAVSICALARDLGRDFKRVHEDVNALEAVGLIEREGGLLRADYDEILRRLHGRPSQAAARLGAQHAGRHGARRLRHLDSADDLGDRLRRLRLADRGPGRRVRHLRDDPERAAGEPEVIAHHFTQGGLDDLAIEWWGKAGDQALRRSAFHADCASARLRRKHKKGRAQAWGS